MSPHGTPHMYLCTIETFYRKFNRIVENGSAIELCTELKQMVSLWELLEAVIVPLMAADTLPKSTEEWQQKVDHFCDAFDSMGYVYLGERERFCNSLPICTFVICHCLLFFQILVQRILHAPVPVRACKTRHR